ncbi:ABC transporter permease [Cupriavidus sp. a3]|uniref:ABC transporter permease n=1 Tax=Cupriavidus sp. a3 TaxID=3242158 RepID=UPI003D9C5CD5
MLVLPFVLKSVYVSMENLDARLEQAAASLGASPLKVLFTIPLLAPGLFGGWLFAAIMSFSEFTASHADTAGFHVQLCPGVCRSDAGCTVGRLYCRDS